MDWWIMVGLLVLAMSIAVGIVWFNVAYAPEIPGDDYKVDLRRPIAQCAEHAARTAYHTTIDMVDEIDEMQETMIEMAEKIADIHEEIDGPLMLQQRERLVGAVLCGMYDYEVVDQNYAAAKFLHEEREAADVL